MLAIEVDSLRNIALGGIALSALSAVILMFVIKSIVGKVITLVFTLAIGVALYTQQDQLKSCADKIQAQLETSGQSAVCSFFGQDVSIDIPSSIGD